MKKTIKTRNRTNRLIIWGVILMTLISMTNLMGCGSDLHSKREKMTKKLLMEKYKEDFVIHTIGKSFGTLTNTTFEAICSPEDDLNLKFMAEIDKDGEWISDEYVTSNVSAKIEKKLSETLNDTLTNFVIKVVADVGPTELSDPDISIKDFLQVQPEERFLIYLVINEKSIEEMDNGKIYDTIVAMFDNLPNISGKLNLYVTDAQTIEGVNTYITKHAVPDSGLAELLDKATTVGTMYYDNVLDISKDDFSIK